MTDQAKRSRKQEILEAFARMLEGGPGVRITTAALAREVGVSEAALYRHFPSKTKMFEGLIEFIEASLFTRVSVIASDLSISGIARCERIYYLVLVFAEKNPGISRILTCDALAGETERLHTRIAQLFDRLDLEVKKILRDAELSEGAQFNVSIALTSANWLAVVEGKIARFVRSQFREAPSAGWQEQWPCLYKGFIAQNKN